MLYRKSVMQVIGDALSEKVMLWPESKSYQLEVWIAEADITKAPISIAAHAVLRWVNKTVEAKALQCPV